MKLESFMYHMKIQQERNRNGTVYIHDGKDFTDTFSIYNMQGNILMKSHKILRGDDINDELMYRYRKNI